VKRAWINVEGKRSSRRLSGSGGRCGEHGSCDFSGKNLRRSDERSWGGVEKWNSKSRSVMSQDMINGLPMVRILGGGGSLVKKLFSLGNTLGIVKKSGGKFEVGKGALANKIGVFSTDH